MISRQIHDTIFKKLTKGKIIIIIGPRQVGKTTLLKQLSGTIDKDILWLNGDEPDIRESLTNPTSSFLRNFIGNKKVVFIDEAQRIENIGITLKLIADNIENIELIATGSSSFELSNKINEPLTGRKIEFILYPLSFNEMVNHHGLITEKRLLENRMIFGYYPEVVTNPGSEYEILREITNSYLYKDLLTYERIRKSSLLDKLLLALALQVGQEVSYREIGTLIGANYDTIEKYIELLEKSYVLFRLSSFSRNLRKEIKKTKKIYFYDNGIRNAIIKNFNPLKLRNDIVALWKNFIISERKKANDYNQKWCNSWFWRTTDGQELDYIEESDGKIIAYEFKWNPKAKSKFPKAFKEHYLEAEFNVVNSSNFTNFIM